MLIDIANPLQLADVPDQPEFELEKILQPDDGIEIQQYTRWQNDTVRRCLTVEWQYKAVGCEVAGLRDGTTTVRTKYHYPYPHTLQMLMQHNHFHWQTIYGNYDRTPFNEVSDRLIILATRANQQ